MIKITDRSKELTKIQEYLMTASPAIEVIKNVPDGTSIPVAAWITFQDIKDTGEVTDLFSIITPDNHAYCCQSSTFIDYFVDIAGLMGDEPFAIVKRSGKTKAGRDFVYCELDLDSIK